MINFDQQLFPQWNSWRPRRSGKVAHNYFIFFPSFPKIEDTFLKYICFLSILFCFLAAFSLGFFCSSLNFWRPNIFTKHCVSSVALMKAQEQLYEIQTEVKRQVTKIYSWSFFKWICLNNITLMLTRSKTCPRRWWPRRLWWTRRATWGWGQASTLPR